MKSTLSILLIFAMVACSDGPSKGHDGPAAPKALQDESELKSSLRSGEGDIVDELYDELASKDSALLRFEKMRMALIRDKADSLEVFDRFDGKNMNYFASAHRLSSDIKDSVLRKRTQDILSSASKEYELSVAEHRKLVGLIDSSEAQINDIRIALMITRTLPFIRKYQKDSRPSTAPMEGFLERQKRLLRSADSLVNKLNE